MSRRRLCPFVLLLCFALGRMAEAGDFAVDWLAVSDAAKESQPHWMTPVITVTPRLEQEFRYDQSWQARSGSVNFTSYGVGKGLELIPMADTEVIVGVPAYQTKISPKGREEGWTDENVLLKYRGIAANEEQGNYIVTGFLGVSIPSGNEAFTNHHAIITPTLAVGKGWGTRVSGFDLQSTLGVGIPTGGRRTLGMPIAWNTALQAHVLSKLWPELEATYIAYKDGPNDGKKLLALAAGVVAGRFELTSRARLIVGAGYQWPASSFQTYNRNWQLTARVAF